MRLTCRKNGFDLNELAYKNVKSSVNKKPEMLQKIFLILIKAKVQEIDTYKIFARTNSEVAYKTDCPLH